MQGFTIWLGEYYLKIKYNHYIYKTTVIKTDNERYWYLKPYDKSVYTTNANFDNRFEFVI